MPTLAEEVAALEAAGIEYEIVPGITAALAAGSYAGIPLTQGDTASAVALITGQERDDKGERALDYAALATFPGTLVFYMGVTTAGHWTTALILAGKPANTPAAIVRRCSWPDQETIPCTLGTVAERRSNRDGCGRRRSWSWERWRRWRRLMAGSSTVRCSARGCW